jgi:hypothetical protein
MIGKEQDVIEWMKDKKEDAIFEITQKREKTIRSLAQNRYYFWIIIDVLSNFHWENPVSMHELIKQTVGVETTTNLSTSDFKFMCELIIETWRVKFWVHIPKPNEVQELESLEKYLF